MKNKKNMIWTIPNVLTYIRILIIPLIFFVMYSDNALIANQFACLLFFIAGISDYFDGYLSRKLNLTSEIGRFLDPIADKLLVSVILIVLAQTKFVSQFETILASIIISREIFVSGLREFLGNFKVKVYVSRLAKWKTAIQLLAMGCLIFGNAHTNQFYNSVWDYFTFYVYVVGVCLLFISAILTIVTGIQYLNKSLKYMEK